MVNLRKHHIPAYDICTLCRHKPETIVHALWDCHFLKSLRTRFAVVSSLRFHDDMGTLDFFAGLKSRLKVFDLEWLVVALWRCWFCRNSSVYAMADILLWSAAFLEEF
ncbi:hypothetical protein ACOSQ3_026268 [Xanthoceras sorbifolium]